MKNRDLDILVNIIQQKLFEKEPLAYVLLSCLNEEGIINSADVISKFNERTETKIKDLINEINEEEKGQEAPF